VAVPVAALCLLLSACGAPQPSTPASPEAAPSSSAAEPVTAPTSAPTSAPEAKPAEPPAPEPPKAIRDGFAYLKEGAKLSVDGDDKAETDGYAVTIRDVKFQISTTNHQPDVAKMKAELAKSGKLSQISVVAFDGGAAASFVAQNKEPKTAVALLKKLGDKVFRCEAKIDGADKDKAFRTSAVKICKTLALAE
jgi:hypothetical protein